MRTITAVTVGRSDWGIYRPVLNRIRDSDALNLRLIVSGAHLTHESGLTVNEIRDDGFAIDDAVDMLLSSDSAVGTAKSMGLGTIGFAEAYQRQRPDLLLVLGDRFEMHAAALAAVPFGIPVAHIHGGEVTHGAIDDVFRHAITKYSHLHFPSTQQHADRIVQLGEEPWRVTVSGAPALDNLKAVSLPDRDELAAELRIDLAVDPLLVTFHPVTLQQDDTSRQVAELTAALADVTVPVIITRPNADPRHAAITNHLEEFTKRHANVRLVSSLGTRRYFGLMQIAGAMVGNSSSGIIEAASFGLPVVNIGLRQSGRPRSANIVDVECSQDAIRSGIAQVCSPDFRSAAGRVQNIYGDGCAAEIITNRLATVALNDALLLKRFYDVSVARTETAAA